MPTRQLFQTIPPPNSLPAPAESKSSSKSLILGIAIGGGAGAVIFLVACLLFLFRRLKKSRTSPYEGSTVKLQKFAYRELKNATENFNPSQRLGQGGFGVVYKGTLKNGKDVAVKKLDTSSLQGEREFQNEVSVIGRVNSPHIVSLLGYCVDGKKRLLVYEYMENGSLQEALFDEMYAASLDWDTRFKILLDTARGLAFLHYKCDPPIIHGDVKPSNILLDKHFAARIADFGLARLKSEEAGPAVRSEEVEREHAERERIRYERVERERARRALRRREEAERKKALGNTAGSPDVKSSEASPDKRSEASPEKRWEGTHEKSPLGRTEDVPHTASSPKQSDFLTIAVHGSPTPSAQESVVSTVPYEISGGDAYTTLESPLTPAEEIHKVTGISTSYRQSPLSTQPSPSIALSSPSTPEESPIQEVSSPTSNEAIGELPVYPLRKNAENDGDAGAVASSSEAASPEDVKKDGTTEDSSPVADQACCSSSNVAKEDDVVFQVPDASKDETEPEGWSTISPSEGYRDDMSVESGGVGRTSGPGKEKKLFSRDWWWRQDTNSGDLTIKDFINWTPKTSAADGKRKSPSSIKDWAGLHDSSGDVIPVSDSRRFEKKKIELSRNRSKSSVGSEGWGEFSGELTAKKKESKRDRDKYTMREWWKEDGELSKSKRELAKSKSRDSSKLSKTRSREWWREEFSGELTKNPKVPKSGPLLSLSREGSRREKNKSREWWREENSGELSRTNSSRHAHASRNSGEMRREGRREKSRSRDWFSGDLLGRAAVSSTPSMRGTICYVAPEYGGGGILSEKSDVYSFGVLMLVIISGRRPLQVMASPIVEFERANLISWARHLAQSGNVLDLVDNMLQGQYSKEQAVLCITVALLCLQRLPAVRPTMGEVVKILLGESDLPSLPFEFSPSPPYFLSRRKASVERVTASEVPLLA